jgi:archaemetzincin
MPQPVVFGVPIEMLADRESAGPIELVPVGEVAEERLAFVCRVMRDVYGSRCRVAATVPVPPEAWTRDRAQVDADAMLGLLVDRFPDDASRVLAITERDMYAAGRPYVFGYGHLRDRVAIVSTARLDERFYGRAGHESITRVRLYKAVVHEVGHTAGNPHCHAPVCVMREVADLDALDSLSPTYCAECMARMRRELKVAPSDAQAQFALGAALLRRRQYDRAVLALGRATMTEPDNAIYQNDFGVALLRRGDKRAAMRAFQRAKRLRPDLPEPVYNLRLVERGMVAAWEPEIAETATGSGPGPSWPR